MNISLMSHRTRIILGLFFSLILVTAIALYQDWEHYWSTAAGVSIAQFEVRPGESSLRIMRRVEKHSRLKRPLYVRLALRMRGQLVRAGTYQLSARETPTQLLNKFVTGAVRRYSFTIVPGWTARQMLVAMRANPMLEHGDGPTRLEEGYYLPETYYFPRHYRMRSLLHRSQRDLHRVLAKVWANRAVDLPLQSPQQLLILASIVEKETAISTEKPLIARVFLNRLQKHMRLQTDPSVIYGIGPTFNGNLTRTDLKRDTPYNTYTRRGLPPGPIALADIESLRAVAHPANSDALYFVADGSGGHVFATTLEQHNRNVHKYLLKRSH